MGDILASLEIKKGDGTYAHCFKLSKDKKKSTPEENIGFFVAEINNIEKSSCLVTPLKVKFLLNEKGVARRTFVLKKTGPQMPTPVDNLLTYGTNLLQAIGTFEGHYIVVIAFMSMISTPDLQVYEHPTPPLLPNSDSELIVGPSRISLKCPISSTCIKIPVKGHLCNHLQCFDYENYMEINSRVPSWRCLCLCCKNCLTLPDIRIDQNMVKVLKEVGENVNDVLISSDGSWKAIMESDNHNDKPQDQATTSRHDETVQTEYSGITNAPTDIVDLTVDDYETDTFNIGETESHMNSTNETNQNTAVHIDDDFWSGVHVSMSGSGPSSSRSRSQILGQSPNQEAGPFHGNALVATSIPQTEISPMNFLQVQPFEFGTTSVVNEFGRFSSIRRNVSRTRNAAQAFSSQSPTAGAFQELQMLLDANGLSSLPSNMMQQFSRTNSHSLESSRVASPTLQQHQQVSSLPSNMLQPFSRTYSHSLQSSRVASPTLQQHQQIRHSPTQFQSSHRVSSAFPTELQATGQQQPMLNTRAGLINLTRGMMRPPSASFSQGSSQASFGQATGIDVGSLPANAMVVSYRMTQTVSFVQPFRASFPSPVNIGHTPLMGRQREHVGLNLSPGTMRLPSARFFPSSSQAGIGQATGILGSLQARPMAASYRDAQMVRPVQPSSVSSPYPVNIGYTPLLGHQSEHVGGVAPPVTETNISMNLQEQNWCPTGCMLHGSASTSHGSGGLPEHRD